MRNSVQVMLLMPFISPVFLGRNKRFNLFRLELFKYRNTQ